jgi:hypothetical protein
MKALVVRDYVDKLTGELHHTGDAVILTPERYEEIKKAGRFVVPVKDDEPAPVPVDAEEESPVEETAPVEEETPAEEPKKRRNRKA